MTSPASRTRARGRGAGAFDLGQMLRRSRCDGVVDDRVGLLRVRSVSAATWASNAPACSIARWPAPRSVSAMRRALSLGVRQVGEQHADVGPRRFGGAVERRAMLRPASAMPAFEVGGDRAEPVGGLVAKAHQVAGHRPSAA